jgi:hypothetical protein
MNADLTIETGPSSPDVVISGWCPRGQATKLLDLATDLRLSPAFAEEDIARQRTESAHDGLSGCRAAQPARDDARDPGDAGR